ncbi:MAG: hypothetical protein ACRCYU_18230 [Nocardioides sp.]
MVPEATETGQEVTEVSPLAPGSRLLHIGPQKTGSTALQAALHQARPRLRELGVLYPGPTPRPWEALGAGLGLSTPRGGPRPTVASWHRLLTELAEPDVRVSCISHEGLGRCRAEAAERVIVELGGPRPHVLAVARGYDRLLPSQWQQRVKARMNHSYDEWLRIVLEENSKGKDRDPAWRNLWVPHDTARLVTRWARLVGPENFTLVIASERDRALLPRTCERLLGVPEGILELKESKANRSLTYPEVELLRGLNRLFDQHGWSDEDYFDLVASGVAPTLLKSPAPVGAAPIPTMPTWARRRVVELSAARVRALSALDIRIVGDLDTLLVAPTDPVAESPPDQVLGDIGEHVPDQDSDLVPAEVALRALEGMADAVIKGKRGQSRRARSERRAAGGSALTRL